MTSILCNGIYRCVVCFAKSNATDEPYQVIKGLNFPIMDAGWNAYE